MTAQILPANFESFIFQSGDDLKTTSLKVAEAFKKRHDDVLKKLRSLECSEEFAARNFAESKYLVSGGKNSNREETMYEMTKDGFMFLVMGFTGKAAAQIKEAYINAFNLMHAKLFPKQPSTAPSTLTTEMERHVQEMVNALKHKTGKVHNTIYHELKTYFKVSTYTDIPIVKYAEVCAYFGEKPIYTAPELIQCDSRYLGELERKAATLLELEQRKTAFVEISNEQVVIERQRFNELEFIAKCVTEPQSRFMSIMRRFDKTNLSDMATLLEAMCHATPIKPKNVVK